jgi:FdhD protein
MSPPNCGAGQEPRILPSTYDVDGKILASCEDVNRSGYVDKTAGAAILAGVDLSGCALITSGRLSSVIVAKAARAGFPVLVSRSAPMD